MMFAGDLWSEVVRLIHNWWYVDRVRIPRSVGRLLRLDCGHQILIGGRMYEVIGKEYHEDRQRLRIRLTIREANIADGPLWYLVGQVGTENKTNGESSWKINSPAGASYEIDADGIVCFMNNSN